MIQAAGKPRVWVGVRCRYTVTAVQVIEQGIGAEIRIDWLLEMGLDDKFYSIGCSECVSRLWHPPSVRKFFGGFATFLSEFLDFERWTDD